MLGTYKQKTFTLCLFVVLSAAVLFVPEYAMVHTTGRADQNETRRLIKVIDRMTEKPVPAAFVTSGNEVARTDENGMAYVNVEGSKIAVRACGYLRAEEMIPIIKEEKPLPFSLEGIYSSMRDRWEGDGEKSPEARDIKLTPFAPRGLYLSFYGIGDRSLRSSALKLIEETELNALVIDVKGDRAMIPYKSAIPLASEVGAQKIITVKDMGGLIKSFKANGIYSIARIVVFKDNLLAQNKPEWAVKTQNGQMWHDREGLAWVDPFKKEVWDYNIDIAVEAAQQGFDEIQFDYVRFPDSSSPRFSMANTKENRVQAVSGFLMEARRRLEPYNVFLSADIFGYVCWNLNDTNIGQTLEDVTAHVDYVCPMLYPSGFQYGIPGFRIPTKNPYEIVHLTLKRAQERTNLPPVRFRPWLQAFKDYAFDRRSFEDREIRDQISAGEKFGSHGWMLWNPRNSYTTNGLKKEGPSETALQSR